MDLKLPDYFMDPFEVPLTFDNVPATKKLVLVAISELYPNGRKMSYPGIPTNVTIEQISSFAAGLAKVQGSQIVEGNAFTTYVANLPKIKK